MSNRAISVEEYIKRATYKPGEFSGECMEIADVMQLITLVREECKEELLAASGVMIHPHIEGVFAVIEEKQKSK